MDELIAQLVMYSYTIDWWNDNHIRDEKRVNDNKQEILNDKVFIEYLKVHKKEYVVNVIKH